MYKDTIVAIATPPGQGGIGVVRLSGPEAWSIASRLFNGTLEDRHAAYGHVRDPETRAVIDEALVTPMKGPRTYTGEDAVEISCHGSPVALQKVVGAALRLGARAASPGEFTLRAFLNGRIDLAQAESVLDIIQAQSDASLRLAVQGLQGRLSERIGAVRERLLQVQAYLTACIDFPEDEVESQIDIKPRDLLQAAKAEIATLIASADSGIVYRQGVRTAIVGRPNVGKSSLLNRLLGEERAIVTAVPGTTRDTVEETVSVQGVPFHLVDTAGIRETKDAVEAMGIERSRKAAGKADLVLVVIDASAPLTNDASALIEMAKGKPAIIVANKCDLPMKARLAELPSPVVRISALTGAGMDALHEAMAIAALGGKVATTDAVLVTNERHKAALQKALAHVEAAARTLAEKAPEDFITIDLAAALGALGEITGESATEEVLDRIFAQFCIGK